MKRPSVSALVLVAVVVIAGLASADPKPLRGYDGQIVISPDPAPSSGDELAAYVKANATADRHYELIKGPPWDINLVGVLSKEPGKEPVMLVFADAADKKLTPIQSIQVSAKQRLVIAHTSATTAAGFEANKTYVVRLMVKTTALARAELKLRD